LDLPAATVGDDEQGDAGGEDDGSDESHGQGLRAGPRASSMPDET
jgi:hypothetical protein